MSSTNESSLVRPRKSDIRERSTRLSGADPMTLPQMRFAVRRKRIAVALLLLVFGGVLWHFGRGRGFDPVAWQDPVRVKQGVRLEMADRLVARGTLRGRTRQQVIQMLGKPSDEGYFRDWPLVYWIGPERGFMSIDSEWLVLRLGPDDRVIECRIVRD